MFLNKKMMKYTGDTNIDLFCRRKVKVTPGMFSYFKTDEKVNIVIHYLMIK
jgi:hypothetical protein